MKEKKKKHPALFLLMIPIAIVLFIGMVFLGIALDLAMTTPGGQGHGIPIFSALAFIVGGIALLAAIIVSIILFINGIRKM